MDSWPPKIAKNEAEAVAQFSKRVGFTDLRQKAKDDEEAYEMRALLINHEEYWLRPDIVLVEKITEEKYRGKNGKN